MSSHGGTAVKGYRPPRSTSVRWINAAGRLGHALGLTPFRLDTERMLEKAAQRTGVEDWGDSAFLEPFRRYLRALETEARLSPVGRLLARQDLSRLLENRLKLVDERKRNPEIGDEEIVKPLFIVGLPRTGTSILHELMAQDPENRTPLTWEVMWPIPRPRFETYESDPRIALMDRNLKAVDQLIPGFKAMHPMGAQLPQECVMLMCHDFMSMQFHCTHRVPSYMDWLEGADLTPTVRSHKEQLRLLQSLAPARHWVLKSPQHLWYLDALLEVYPDAQIVQTHRDPVKCAASTASLVSLLRGMASDEVDPAENGADWAGRIALGLDKAMDVRERLGGGEERIFDMYFHEYMRDPIGMVRRIYEHFGRVLSPGAEANMRAFLEANPRDKHGRHEYTLGGYGLDLRHERKRFERYQERFAPRIEEEAT